MQASVLPGTENAGLPFRSPDGRFIAYAAGGKLRMVDSGGGTPQVLADTPAFQGGTWNRDGVILFGTTDGPLYQVPASGGVPKPVLPLDTARQEIRQTWPHFLPDGRHYLYSSLGGDRGGVFLGSLDSRETRLVVDSFSNANWVSPGFLLFGSGNALMAQPFDSGTLRLGGAPSPVANRVVSMANNMHGSFFASSVNGTLVYRTTGPPPLIQPAWYDRNGKRLGSVGSPRVYQQMTLSPDEKWLAMQVGDPGDAHSDLWLLDLASGILSRLTSDAASKDTVVWSPDGHEILYSSDRSTGVKNLYRKAVGGGEPQLVFASPEPLYPGEWLRDGSYLFLNDNGRSFSRLAPGGAKPETLFDTTYAKDEPRVSPDGRWVAYNTDESGRWEVYIASFPDFANRRQISNKGGAQGYWRKDGKELFYLSTDGDLVSVSIQPGPSPEPGIPKVLFRTRVAVAPWLDQFVATGDGQRFLFLERLDATDAPVAYSAQAFTIVVDWPAAVRK